MQSVNDVPDFADFDRRHYRVVSVQDGYREWLPSYEASVDDAMDLALLERIETIQWSRARRAVDLGCGTGRTAAWLRTKGVDHIDGVDVTPEMLDAAPVRGAHERLVEADVRATGLDAATYELAVCCLVDEHLDELSGLYREARRLLRDDGMFTLVGYHPAFIMRTGMPTHYDTRGGEHVAIETHVHLLSEHFAAAGDVGFTALELHEGVIDDEWVRHKPRWAEHRGWPISFACVWLAA